ncbi:hypothetical protein ZWY2020_027860 [Hordeum vulgare]|nr:hypothetical protein ZWY2020_027860 [Hordeum vulgare]
MGLFWSRPTAMQPIMLNEQAIVNNLTEDNVTRMWASRTTWEDEQLYIVLDQGTTDIGHPASLVVKKFQNENPALQVDANVKYRYKSEMILLTSSREDAIMLVYGYPVNGSLRSWLHQPMDDRQPLSWPQRRLIAIGTAKAPPPALWMHKPIIHHNISSDNILLDQNCNAVITNFDDACMHMAGLGQPLPIIGVRPGNFGFKAPGIIWNTASHDGEGRHFHSFGVILLELVTGRMANGAGGMATWRFGRLMYSGSVDCTVVDPQQRPSMHMVLKRLHCLLGCLPFRGLLTRL